MAILLSLDVARQNARSRNVPIRPLETCVAALAGGRNVLILDEEVERGIALAEAIVGAAAASGTCLGSLTLTGNTVLLLSPDEFLTERFRNDVWLIVRSADQQAITRIADYSERSRIDHGWRALLVSREPLKNIVDRTDARTRRRFAYVALEAT